MIKLLDYVRFPSRMTSAMMTAVLSLTLAMDAVASETTIGRWCDRMIPNNSKYNRTMAIVITSSGNLVLKSNFNDGSSSMNELREAPAGVYEKVESSSGDKYRIVQNTGDLQLLDNDGLVRIAVRLENSPQRNECVH